MSKCAELLLQLPPHLLERVRTVGEAPVDGSGEIVLYWMHHAVRDHENPALDVAIHLSARLGKPLLVYQGLAGRHPYNSDRHHTFILEGARDAAPGLERQNARFVFHLPRRPDTPSPLPALARRAALIVSEDFPAPPFPAWIARLAARSGRAVWLVDTACIVPMRTVATFVDRAYRFRAHIRPELDGRIGTLWPEREVEAVSGRDVALPFEPLDLEDKSFEELCAACDIDHSVPPVAHTRGGSSAGYERWRRFLEQGLDSYHRRRNDPASNGVSRLSPYLHHGQVSPFRIAREAASRPSAGSAKFLDELVVWRELAHHLCFHRWQEVESLRVLPAWARGTLREHAADPRPALFDWETLARGETGDRLWDAAQKSLLRHGELHNNVRMTWAKALLQWTSSPEEALSLLLDLNDRFALDGSDPSSYGGILWSLGLFDRPFSPERPILGAVRPRPTASHARRLDLARYESRVLHPSAERPVSVAVIGAGISGAVAGRILADQGHRVTLFDKARGPGGRSSRRRQGALELDHGAQYFTARDPRFRRHLDAWCRLGVVSRWEPKLAVFDDGRLRPRRNGSTESPYRFVGVPGMSAVARHLASSLRCRFAARISGLEREGDGWRLRIADPSAGTDDLDPERYDWVVVSAPAPQAAVLLSPAPALASAAASVPYAPTWAVMVAPSRPLKLPFDGAFVNGGALSWVARNSSKPGRPTEPDTWVLHGSPDWSAEHLEQTPERVAEVLLDELRKLSKTVGVPLPDPTFVEAHRWRYALPIEPLPASCLLDPELRLLACGDWCGGPRIEGAFLSGTAAAGRLLGRLAATAKNACEPEQGALFPPSRERVSS